MKNVYPVDKSLYAERVDVNLREHFAGLAMQGYISAGSVGMLSLGRIAQLSVEAADALIKELCKP